MAIISLDVQRSPEDVCVLARDYMKLPGNDNGGNLHMALIDGNLNLSDLYFSYGYASAKKDWEGVKLALELIKLSKADRRRVYRLMEAGVDEETLRLK